MNFAKFGLEKSALSTKSVKRMPRRVNFKGLIYNG